MENPTHETGVFADANCSISVDPATGLEFGRYPHHDDSEQEAILADAWRAFREWRDRTTHERSAHLAAVASSLRALSDSLSRGISREMGKPIASARAEVQKCATLCDWYAEHGPRLLTDEVADVGGDGEAVIAHLPLGPVLAVMPWNFPLWQVMRAAVPILLAGNTFLLKHADNVQGSAFALEAVFLNAGFPPGIFAVLNVNQHALPRLIADRRVAAVTVTAGVAAGAAVASEAGLNLKKSVLELGGSDPFIVLADADLDRAVTAAVEARFQNAGQVCIAAKRIIVERAIAAKFTDQFVSAASSLRQGDPLDERTTLGPLARSRLRKELHGQVQRSLDMGARLILGGEMPIGPGTFYPATVLTEVTAHMPVFREETFGPVASIAIVDDREKAVAIANDSDYGLSGAIWSSDDRNAAQLARRIETGSVFVNGVPASDPRVPIGGVKQSGYGRELSYFGIREFTNAQLVWRRV